MNKVGHIAIIPDGNRRWAKKHSKSLLEAYDIGIRKIFDVLKWAKEREVKIMSFWGFSTENFKRSEEEKSILWELFDKFLTKGIEEMEKRRNNEVRVNFLGRIYMLPKSIYEKMIFIMDKTKENKPYTLNLLMAYGGRAEIVDAVNKAIKNGKPVDETSFSNYLYTNGMPDPDIIIRTGGEIRLSGLLPWQSVYSELFFINKLWPDFSKDDFDNIMDEFSKRKRKFGK